MTHRRVMSSGYSNYRIGRIKRVLKWAASEELIPPNVFEGLRTVDGLRMGRTTAPARTLPSDPWTISGSGPPHPICRQFERVAIRGTCHSIQLAFVCSVGFLITGCPVGES